MLIVEVATELLRPGSAVGQLLSEKKGKRRKDDERVVEEQGVGEWWLEVTSETSRMALRW